jgi:hypothetical protein
MRKIASGWRDPFQRTDKGRATILIVLADPNPSGIPGSDIYQPLTHW